MTALLVRRPPAAFEVLIEPEPSCHCLRTGRRWGCRVNTVIGKKMKKGTLWGWHRVEERFPVRGNSYILGWSKSLFRFFHNIFLNICEYQEKMPVEKRRVWSHQEEKHSPLPFHNLAWYFKYQSPAGLSQTESPSST